MEKIETIRGWLEAWKQENRKVEIRTVSGETYAGHIATLEEGYVWLKEYERMYISIDKIESIMRLE